MANVLRTAVFGLSVSIVALLPAPRVRAQGVVMQQNPTEVTVINAMNVFAQAMQMPQNEIPRSLLANAQAIAIVPGMMRGAFVFGVQYGRGVLVMRGANGAWQAPRMIQMAGGSFGYQIGVQATDLILVFRTPQSVQNLLRGTLKVGVDASAAAGPVGRQTSAATDLRLAAEILSYSRARGAFVGVSLDGTSISLDPSAEAIYYQPPGAFPASAAHLLQTIQAYATVPQGMAPATGQFAPAPTTGWVAPGQRTNDVETTRQQLDAAARQLFSTPGIADNATWQQYLALPPEVYVPNQTPNPQALQQALDRYETVAKQPEYAALQVRPEFQQTLTALRRMGEVRTASNTSATLPAPPK